MRMCFSSEIECIAGFTMTVFKTDLDMLFPTLQTQYCTNSSIIFNEIIGNYSITSSIYTRTRTFSSQRTEFTLYSVSHGSVKQILISYSWSVWHVSFLVMFLTNHCM